MFVDYKSGLFTTLPWLLAHCIEMVRKAKQTNAGTPNEPTIEIGLSDSSNNSVALTIAPNKSPDTNAAKRKGRSTDKSDVKNRIVSGNSTKKVRIEDGEGQKSKADNSRSKRTIRPSAKIKATMINKSDAEEDTAAAPKNLFAEKPLVPKIEPASFVFSYRIIVIVITHPEVYNSIGKLRFDLRDESSNTKNQESDSQDESMTSADNHSEHSIQLRKAKKTKKIQDGDTTVNSTKGKHVAESSDSENEDYRRKEKSNSDQPPVPALQGNKKDNNSGSETAETLRLMPFELRDPELASDYLRLPSLKLCIMQPFSAAQRGKIRNESFSSLVECMDGRENEQRLFKAAVKFQFSLPFINPARAPSSLVNFEHGKFIIGGSHEYSGHNAVFLLPGHVMESHLVEGIPSVEANAFNNNLPGPLVKRIKVRFLSIEYERFCSFIGTHLPLQDDRAYVGPTSVLGVTFSTKKIDFTSDTSSIPTTPSRSNRFLSAVATKSRIDSDDETTNMMYPQYLMFSDAVKVYDARNDGSFAFRPEDLKHVKDLPLFKKGKHDILAEKYVATIAFTVGSFPYNGSYASTTYKNYSQVTLNLLFVIVLGKLNGM
ncbi:hypothetical protein F5887DRAFT_921131 [Amanita rubescens]|nr:hypothetical protein F5887DRAFT_921131 [Amanita rubescens]